MRRINNCVFKQRLQTDMREIDREVNLQTHDRTPDIEKKRGITSYSSALCVQNMIISRCRAP